MNVRLSICGFLVLLLTGCQEVYKSTVGVVITPSPVLQEPSVALTQEEKARLYDISFPLSVEPFKIAMNEDCSIVGYCTVDSLEKVVLYHTADMEYWGWEKHLCCIADEACLIFRKPLKECVITCRHDDTGIRVVLFIGDTSPMVSNET